MKEEICKIISDYNKEMDFLEYTKDIFYKQLESQLIYGVEEKERSILTTTNTIKQEVLNFEDIRNAIQLLDKNKAQVILLNYDIRGWFEKIVGYENSGLDRFGLCSLMGINIINYPYEKFNFYFHGVLEKYDEIIWIPKEGEIYIIDSKKFLEFINKK